jgi:hyperosmotically inducible periplasmic protein
MKYFVAISFLSLPGLLLGMQSATAQSAASSQSSTETTARSTAADNTKNNRDDPANRGKTSDQQENDAADLELSQRIRRSVMNDKTLSTYGHNVKIVAVNGTVTLNGVVRSAEEKTQIGMKATSVAGKERVVNDLKIEPSK